MAHKLQERYESVGVAAAGQLPAKPATQTATMQFHHDISVARRTINHTPATPLVPLPRPQWLPENVWPFQTSTLKVDGCKIAVTDVGQGPVLLFMHTGFWSFIWRDVILRLAPDFRCICFDAPGTGQSDRLPARSITLEKASRALTAVVEALNLHDITLVFHDLGGPSGIAGAARAPDQIRGLCAVNAFAWKPSGIRFRGMLALMGSTAMREFSALTGILARVTSSAFGIGLHMDESGRKAFYAGVGRQGVRAFHAYLHDARKSQANLRGTGPCANRPISPAPAAHTLRRAERSLGIPATLESALSGCSPASRRRWESLSDVR